jgi:formylglycine-generating enzyme required for sulfatase activity
VNLRNACLRWSNLSGAELVGVDLDGADLRGANLSGTDLRQSSLSGAELSGAMYSDETRWPEGSDVPLGAFECMVEEDKSEASVYVPGYGELVMRLVSAGTFWMGSQDDDADAESDEKPRHEVRLSRSFQLSPVQVTQGLYEVVKGNNPSHFKTSAEHPVERVSWFDAVLFCNALSDLCGFSPAYTLGDGDKPSVSCDFSSSGFRLPTEAEWEYAARAGQDLSYSGSNNADEVAWHKGDSGGRTHPVGQLKPNAWGLYDMSGNVWEWCWDWKGSYPRNASVDPSGPSTGSGRVLRGGSWNYWPASHRSAFRDWSIPAMAGNILGLRLSRS